jgi:hypothetical protein
MIKYHPILFSPPMVQAILEGRKTQTRRIVKDELLQNPNADDDLEFILLTVSHKIKEGDFQYFVNTAMGEELGKWKPSIHMPKQACRIFLKIKSAKIERLNDISECDAIEEGCSKYGPFGEFKGSIHPNGGSMRYRAYSKASRAFQCIWETINGEGSWCKNPFVWVYEFELIDKPLDFII